MKKLDHATWSKVPAVTLSFWLIKIAATTLGETGGDALSMSMHMGYAVSTLVLIVPFAILLTFQIHGRRFHPALYWAVVVGTTLAGTTMADFADRSLGVGYAGGTAVLVLLVVASLAVWKLSVGTISPDHIVEKKAELFYWITILFSNTLGTALGDWTSEKTGFSGGVFFFLGLIGILTLLYFFSDVSRTALFWFTFVLTRPLGANLGDLLTKPNSEHGLSLSRFAATAVIAALMVLGVAFLPNASDRSLSKIERVE